MGVLELTTLKIIQIILCGIMLFAFGMKFDVTEEARKIASVIWIISVILIFVISFLN